MFLFTLLFFFWTVANIVVFCMYFDQSNRLINEFRSDFDTQGLSFAQIGLMVVASLAVMLAYIKWWATYTDIVDRFTKWLTTPRVKKNP